MEYIDIGLERNLFHQGIRYPVRWYFHEYPSLLILGNTGSGKSYMIESMLGNVTVAFPTAKIWVADFKNDWKFLSGCLRYGGYKDALSVIDDFYRVFTDRLQGDPDRSFGLLFIDEYISLTASMEKKEAEELKKRMATMLFMIRSQNLHVALGCQRGLAADYPYGSRDCLNVVFMGTPSKESIHSFCGTEDAALMEPCPRGAGYVVFDGKKPIPLFIPEVVNMAALESAIKRAVTQ